MHFQGECIKTTLLHKKAINLLMVFFFDYLLLKEFVRSMIFYVCIYFIILKLSIPVFCTVIS